MLSFVESVAQSAAINTQDFAFPLSCESVGTLHFSRTVLKNTMALHLPCFETCLLPDQEKRNACLQKVCIKEKKKVKLLTFNMCISSGFFLFFFFFSPHRTYVLNVRVTHRLFHNHKHTTFTRHLPVSCLSCHAKGVQIKQIMTAASVFTRKVYKNE